MASHRERQRRRHEPIFARATLHLQHINRSEAARIESALGLALSRDVENPQSRSTTLRTPIRRSRLMKVLVFVKATPNSEKGFVPDEKSKQIMADMGKFNEELVKAGIMQMGDGLKPSSHGKRIKFTDSGHASVIDGPFAETKELVAGFWIWQVKSLDEAVEWAKRCPNPMPGEEGVLEIRPVYEMEDLGEVMTEEHRERAARLRKQIERQQKPKAKKAPAKAKSKPAKRKPARARSKK
jgi:hypothetical protein